MPGWPEIGPSSPGRRAPADPLLLLVQGHGAIEIPTGLEDEGLVAERNLLVARILGHRGPSADCARRLIGPHPLASRRSARPQRTGSNAPLRSTLKGDIRQEVCGRLANAFVLGFLIR
jgi:hypothetical protein